MGHFPFFMEIGGKKGVILGGGRVAARKVEKLLPFGPVLTCIAPAIEEELEQLSRSGEALTFIYREACEEDLEGACFVIAATDKEEVNAWAAGWCRERHIPVNVVDDREKCSFFFPALIQEGPLTVGISTDGKSPAAASFVRKTMEQELPEGLGNTIEILGRLRERVLEFLPEQKRRAACLEALFVYCRKRDFKAEEPELETYLAELLEASAPAKGGKG